MRGRAVCLGAVLLAVAPALVNAGYTAKTNYILHCQGCHGADGVGRIPDQVPPLSNSMGYFLHVPGGRRYLAQVPGIAHVPIDDAEVAALLNFALRRFSSGQLPAPFVPYSTEEVARHRRAAPDVISLREELVTAIRERLGVRIWTEDDPSRGPEPGRRGGPLY